MVIKKGIDMKKIYISPTLDILRFALADIMTQSPIDDVDGQVTPGGIVEYDPNA